jgi:hypothetical protein
MGYTLTRAGLVEGAVFDLQGRRVKTLVHRVQDPGEYEILWDGTSQTGGRVPVGVDLIRMRAGSRERTQKVALLPSG